MHHRRVSIVLVCLATLALLTGSTHHVAGVPSPANPFRSAFNRLRNAISGDAARHVPVQNDELGGARGPNLSPDGMFAGVTVNSPTSEMQQGPAFEGITNSRRFLPGPTNPNAPRFGQTAVLGGELSILWRQLQERVAGLNSISRRVDRTYRDVRQAKEEFRANPGNPNTWRSYNRRGQQLMSDCREALQGFLDFQQSAETFRATATSREANIMKVEMLARLKTEAKERAAWLHQTFDKVQKEVGLHEATAHEIEGRNGRLQSPRELEHLYRQAMGRRSYLFFPRWTYKPVVTRARFRAARRRYAQEPR